MNPLELPSLAAWYDASDFSTFALDSSNRVSSWTDKSGNSRTQSQGSAANQPIWLQYAGAKYGYCNGVAGNGITTPDSATISITGDLEIIIDVLPDSWSTGSSAAYIAKYVFSTANRSWRLVSATGTRSIQLSWSADGTATVTAAFADHGITSGRQALKVTLDVDNGAGGWTAKLWKAATYLDSWTLVDTQTGVGTTSIYDGTAPLEVGSQNNLATLGVSGKYYYASVASGIGGAPAAIFTPSLYTSGATFTASTGEVWTVNGGAHIVTQSCIYGNGTSHYLKSSTFTLNQPVTIYWCGSMLTWTASDYLCDGDATNSGALVQTTSTPRVNLNAGSSVAANSGMALKTRGVFCAIFNGASSSLTFNRTAATTGDAGAGNMGAITLLARGAGDAGWLNGVLNEFIAYTGAHDAGARSRVTQYLGQKWGFSP